MTPQSSDRMDELIALSMEIGDPARDYVILSEGNTSARISEHSFWVKGSGVRLQQAHSPQAFVAMELEPLMHALRREDALAEVDLRPLLTSARVRGQENPPEPSIETFVRAICLELGGAQFVAHTHPTANQASHWVERYCIASRHLLTKNPPQAVGLLAPRVEAGFSLVLTLACCISTFALL